MKLHHAITVAAAFFAAATFVSGAEGDIPEFTDKSSWSATVSSSGDGNGAQAIINGNEGDMWQCAWSQQAWFCIDLGSRRTIRAFKYRPRQNDHSIKDYNFWVLDAPVASDADVAALPASHVAASEGTLPFTNDPTYVEVEKPQVGRYVVFQSLSTYQHSAGCREFWLYGENAVVPAFAFWPASTRLYTADTMTFALSAADHGASDPALYADLAVSDPNGALASVELGNAVVTAGAADAATFTAGVCDQGDLTVTASALTGTATLTLSEGTSTLGALPSFTTVESVARVVRLVGTPGIGVGIGTSSSRTIEIVDAELPAPGAIPVTVGTPSTGNATASGDASIPDGAFASAGAITFTGVSEGATAFVLTLGNGFVFEENGTSSLTITVSTLGNTIYVSPVGSDSNLGSSDSPLRSVTAAATLAMDSGADISIAAGLYDAAHGEVFPILPPNGIEITGVAGATRTPADSTVIDCGGANGFFFPATPNGAGLLKDLVISNSLDYAVKGQRWFGTVDNCVFEDASATTDDGAVFSIAVPNGQTFSLAFTNCVFRRIATTGNFWFNLSCYYGAIDFADCVFEDLSVSGNSTLLAKSGPLCIYSTYCNKTEDVTARFDRCTFDRLSVTKPSGDPTNSAGFWENGFVNPWCKAWLDRCVFSRCNGTIALVGGNRGQLHLYNSLFYGIDCGAWGVVRDFYGSGVDVRNCTFDQVSNVFHTDQFNGFSTVRNLSISHATQLNSMDGSRLILKNCNLYDTPSSDVYSVQYDTVSSSGITSHTPDYIAPYDSTNPGAENYRLWSYSELIDIGDNDAIVAGYGLDLAGNARAFSASGVATVDLGAYESRFGSADAVAFSTPGTVLHIFKGETFSVPVAITPAPGAAVQAAVTTGADLSATSSTLSFPTGAETVSLELTASQTLSGGDGERVIVTVVESGTSAGVEPLAIAVYLHEKQVTLNKPGQLYIREGSTLDIPVVLASEGATAPSDIPVAFSSGAGGSNAISWADGSQAILAGDAESEGVLRVTGGVGANTVTFTVGGGFVFAETGTDSATIEIVGYSGAFYVDSANGSDTGYGTSVEDPFATITHALTVAGAGDTIRILPGTYSAATGETLPISPVGVLLQGYDPAGPADRTAHVIDGGNGVDSVVTLLAADGVAGLENLWIRETRRAAISIDASDIAITNVLFTQSVQNRADGYYGAITFRNDSQVEAVDCCFTGMVRSAVVAVTAHTANYNSNFRALRCRFQDNYSNSGTVSEPAQAGEVAGRFFLTDCEFIGNRVDNGGSGDGYCSSAIFIWGRHYLPSTIQVDRCRFIGNSGGCLVSISNTAGELPTISNSLIAGNNSPCCLFLGYSWKMAIHNCTFVGNTGGYAARSCDRDRYGMHIFNSILLNEGTLTFLPAGSWGNSGAVNLRLHDTIVYGCGAGEGYDTANSANVIETDPLLRNVAVAATDPAFDASPLASSPVRDAAVAANVIGTLDIAGNPRTLFKGADLGCYEIATTFGTMLMLK